MNKELLYALSKFVEELENVMSPLVHEYHENFRRAARTLQSEIEEALEPDREPDEPASRAAPDENPSYRAAMIDAGRGRLLR